MLDRTFSDSSQIIYHVSVNYSATGPTGFALPIPSTPPARVVADPSGPRSPTIKRAEMVQPDNAQPTDHHERSQIQNKVKVHNDRPVTVDHTPVSSPSHAGELGLTHSFSSMAISDNRGNGALHIINTSPRTRNDRNGKTSIATSGAGPSKNFLSQPYAQLHRHVITRTRAVVLWYEYIIDEGILTPPPPPADLEIPVGALFVCLLPQRTVHQAWIRGEGGQSWEKIKEGDRQSITSPRLLAFTQAGEPRWLVSDTIKRRYKHCQP
ncbi:hypothetical protein BJ138DRAFT_1115058 [Hygrophoropsis aurantiaca]|uniref:Uncharacterized protein n=1 Tax=Hygrophoropsis aurantiaca TaxID=72124 RepID=A0ACB8A8C5_9AGAM|nr:hypothetical protein BJ138DRAFT_1115058 [Hygrophoropsis aurantiaca]